MTKRLLILSATIVLVASLSGWQPAVAESPPVLITEVQTGFIDSSGLESPRQEFIELTNTSNTAVNITGWRLEYLSAANNGTGAATQVIASMNGQISPNGHGIWEHDGYSPVIADGVFGVGDTSSSGFLAKTGGHVRLMSDNTMIDCVSWGSAVAITGCDKVSATAPAGYTIQRRLVDGFYNKTAGVANISPATPQGGNVYALMTITPGGLPANPTPTNPQPTCDNVQLSEILANPAGDDTLGEFIELYNPTNVSQPLQGCSLRLASGKQYDFPAGTSLGAQEYKAFNYATTGLQLSNSGSTVTLITDSQETNLTYPAANDDEAWALIDGIWYSTNQATPNAANESNKSDILVASTASPSSVVNQLQPCPAGKYRSSVTNRCRNIDQPTTSQQVCATDQERNPATGRCRKIVTANVQAACQPGQERNPASGRCRKIEVAATPKPCDAGQERSPDTNRCRKVVPNSGGKVLAAATTKKTYHYWLVGGILGLAIGYAFYEYRHDFANLFRRLKISRG